MDSKHDIDFSWNLIFCITENIIAYLGALYCMYPACMLYSPFHFCWIWKRHKCWL